MSDVHTVTEPRTLILRHGAAQGDETPAHSGPPAMDTDTNLQNVAAGQAGDLIKTDHGGQEKLETSQPVNKTTPDKSEMSNTTKPKRNKNASPGMSQLQNAAKPKRNKNAQPGKPASQSATSTDTVSKLATQVSLLDIDGPQVDLPVSVSGPPQPQVCPSPTMAASTSSTSMAASSSTTSMASSSSSVGAEDDLEYGGVAASSMQTSCLESNLQTGSKKEDFVILHSEEDEDDALVYKKHLIDEARRLGFKDLKVKLFSEYGFGQSELNSLQNVPDDFHHALIYMTPKVCEDYNTQFNSEVLSKFNRKVGPNCKVTPIWTEKDLPLPLQYISLFGLPYWRFKNNCNPDRYIDTIKTIVRQIRKVQ